MKTGDGFGPADQTFEALTKLRFVMTVLPIIGLVIAIILFMKKYQLDEKRMEEIATEINQTAE